MPRTRFESFLLASLPRDIWKEIFSYLIQYRPWNPIRLLRVRSACRAFYELVNSSLPAMFLEGVRPLTVRSHVYLIFGWSPRGWPKRLTWAHIFKAKVKFAHHTVF